MPIPSKETASDLLDPFGAAILDLIGPRHARVVSRCVWEVRSRWLDILWRSPNLSERKKSLFEKYVADFPESILHAPDDPRTSAVLGHCTELDTNVFRIPKDADASTLFRLLESEAWLVYSAPHTIAITSGQLDSPTLFGRWLIASGISIAIRAFEDSDPWWIAVSPKQSE